MSPVFHRRPLKNLTGYSKLRRNRANRGPGYRREHWLPLLGQSNSVRLRWDARDVGGKRSLEALPDATVKEATHIAVGVCRWIRGGGEPVVDRGRGMIEHVGHARPDRGSAGSGGEH